MFDVCVLPEYDVSLRPWRDLFESDFLPSYYSLACEDDEWTPASNITETEKTFVITMEVPGIDMKNTDVSYRDGDLIIKGEKSVNMVEGDTCVCDERYSGAFSRTFSIPGRVEVDKIEAAYKDGILSVTIPKAEESIPKKIIVH